MPTDFFERQAVARRNTSRLVLLFVLAVLGIVGTTFTVAAVAVDQANERAQRPAINPLTHPVPWLAAGGSLLLIGIGSLYKLFELRGGGTVVAERLGGNRVYPNSTNLIEQRLLNVVEEMALASGVPVPPVYFLGEEQGVNAFAAGFSPSDAVIGVTRGCAENLTRDELQGVIAHEFSHILNGDMRLNIRLIGILHGILLLGLVGRMLLRGAAHSGGGRKRDGVMYVLLLGLALMVLGYLGMVLGNLIKAAVSRQREYLADASAVQFTRSADGIGGALKKIGGLIAGSKVESQNAAEASHMFFAEGIGIGLTSLLATHPPLDRRIRAIDPQWDGKYVRFAGATAASEGFRAEVAGLVGAAAGRPADIPVDVVENASEQVGHPTENHRLYAAQLIRELPPHLVSAAHEPYGARAVLFALLLDSNPDVRRQQFAELEKRARPDVVDLTKSLLPAIDALNVRVRLPLVDMTLPALRAMSQSQYESFVAAFRALVAADDRVALFEWCLHHILLRHLRPQFEPIKPKPVRYYGLQRLSQPCSVLFSALARAGHAAEQAAHAFRHAAAEFPKVRLDFLPADACSLGQLQPALDTLATVSAKQRGRLVDGCAACICADSQVTFREAELLRAVCDILDCPMPPLLPGQHVAPRSGVAPVTATPRAESR